MIRHEIYEKELEKQKLKMAKEAEEEAKRIQEEKIAEVERIKREQLEKESVAAKSRKSRKHKSQPRDNFRRKSLKSKDTMGMNSPTKGKKKVLSDGTSTEHIVISTTKSFAAKIVVNPVHTGVSKQPN